MAFSAFSKTVTINKALEVANFYFSRYSGKEAPDVENSFSVRYENTTVYYVFNYKGGGFVVLTADDALTPVLAQSNE
jgi:hypothetical protein